MAAAITVVGGWARWVMEAEVPAGDSVDLAEDPLVVVALAEAGKRSGG